MAKPKIHQRKSDGAYTFYIAGKHYTRAKKEDAEKLRDKLYKDTNIQYLAQHYSKTTISNLMREWLVIQKGLTNKLTTYDRKEQVVENQIIPFLGKKKVIDLTKHDVQKMLNDLADIGKSYSTIKKAKDYLKAALRYFNILNKYSEDPFNEVKIPPSAPRKDPNEVVFYTSSELEKIYETAVLQHSVKGEIKNIYRLGDSVVVLGETGMRIGEFLALTWENIDFDEKIIKIRKTRQTVKNRDPKTSSFLKYVDSINEPKTAMSKRNIPMSDRCYNALINLHTINGEFEYLSSTSTGELISPGNYARMFKQILIKSGMDKIEVKGGKTISKIYGPHSMRHSFATLLINEKSANIAIVSRLLGHADISVTVNRYVHTNENDLRNVIDLLNDPPIAV